jgi:Putative motility protein
MDALAATGTSDLLNNVAMTMLRKTLDIESSAVLELIKRLPSVGSPPNLGNSLDVRA